MNYTVKDMVIMDIDKGYNIEITRDMVEKSIHAFKNKPVVYNPNQKLLDYNNSSIVDKFYSERVVGIINHATIKDNQVIGEVAWWDDLRIRDKYDNWNIQLNDDRSEFVLGGVEIFN